MHYRRFTKKTGSLLRFICLSLITIALSPLVLQAAQSTFTTSFTTFGSDTTAPTIPTALVATPVAYSQIDLSWIASTDNVGVAGYRIFRDSLFLATTTSTAYSDTGLTAETLYTYEVEAFDASLNFSGHSAPAATTTLAAPVAPTSTPPTPGQPPIGSWSSAPLTIDNVRIVADQRQAIVTFDTSHPAQSKIFWGRTVELELGSLSALLYESQHEMSITGLEPGTAYQMRIQVTDARGASTWVLVSFVTASSQLLYPLQNPSHFTAKPNGDHIRLSWVKTTDPRATGVRIVRSDKFFPRDPYDGVLVYEGDSTNARDYNVDIGTDYYYAIFTKGRDGTYSSGALAKARLTRSGEIILPIGSEDPFANLPQSLIVDPRISKLTILDFEFIQNGKLLYTFGNETVAIDGSQPLTIRLKYEKVPEILKTIAFTLIDPHDSSKVFTFLLRINSDKTYYEATIGALGETGTYGMKIAILDYQNQGLKRLSGYLQALVIGTAPHAVGDHDYFSFFALLLLILLLLLLLLLARRKSKRDDIYIEENTQPSSLNHR